MAEFSLTDKVLLVKTKRKKKEKQMGIVYKTPQHTARRNGLSYKTVYPVK